MQSTYRRLELELVHRNPGKRVTLDGGLAASSGDGPSATSLSLLLGLILVFVFVSQKSLRA